MQNEMVGRLRRAAEPYWQRDYEYGDLIRLLDEAADSIEAKELELVRLAELADSEGTRAVNYMRRARKAEKLLREVLDALPGLQAPNCLGMDLYQRVGTALGPSVGSKLETTAPAKN